MFFPITISPLARWFGMKSPTLDADCWVGNGDGCIGLSEHSTRGLLGVTTPRTVYPACLVEQWLRGPVQLDSMRGEGKDVHRIRVETAGPSSRCGRISFSTSRYQAIPSDIDIMLEEPLVSFTVSPGLLNLVGATILADPADFIGIHHAARALAEDFGRVTRGKANPCELPKPGTVTAPTAIIVGCIESCWLLKDLERANKIDTGAIKGKWESFLTTVVDDPLPGCAQALVIAGSDKRAAIFGAYTLSGQIGVSPWYWWADVPAKFHSAIFALSIQTIQGEPSIQYRGIFINDEAPALTGWVREKFGKYNTHFYKKVYELLLRLKANFMWPAMWPGYPNPGAVFFLDDPENQRIADEYGICVSTSHHEPMQRASTEWFNEHADGTWDWNTHRDEIVQFFREGVERAQGFESYFTIGMRGEYDKQMATDDPGAVLRDVLQQQRKLFKEVHGRADAVPQVLALYKEVQDLYQAGEFTVPDDVTLLFADDNFGTLRRLPSGPEKTRKGGAGIYYHFEYVGAPRSYKWINSNSLGKTYHQLSEAYHRNARKIWVFNVGDIKPIELPLTFAMEMAWKIDSIKADNIPKFLRALAGQYFDQGLSLSVASTWHEYDRLVSLRKHEHIEPDSFSLLHYEEADKIVKRWRELEAAVDAIYGQASAEEKASLWELVVHPVKASSIFTQLRAVQALNQLHARQRRNSTNTLLRKALDLFDADFRLSQDFHSLLDGKWNHIMCQPHIGYGDTWHAPSRDAIFGLAYVQRYQDSNIIVGQMGVAVEGHEGIRAGRINEESERTHPSRRDLVPGLTLGPISRYGPARRWFDIFTRGTLSIHWVTSVPYTWIHISQEEGTLQPDGADARIWITIDWDTVPDGFSGEVLITISSKEGDFEHVHLPIQARKAPASFIGFVESDGCVSIPASRSHLKDPYQHHPDLGRLIDGSITLDSTRSFENTTDIPFLDYPIYLFTDCVSATLSLYFNMTLDIDPACRMSYDMIIDHQPLRRYLLLPASHEKKDKLPAEGWLTAVMDGVWKKDHFLGHLKPGAHTIQIRLNHSNLLLENLVLDLGGVKESYLGPPQAVTV
ncbi:hypothetical protein N7462_002872 [Penicillium macrosclerotiorum]|uniref:uncharacterized protein n=1 Tax=Penicillium macrosclerotiorum TaxID=303699 RepID=UPI002546998C|nr:uncharacterized protein N7462_002872 [Penicillium macrosclerotiorum]KAJ5693449.1 hypothetical protein N7462_002872 [Penicillium macrosclerotiorum]